MPPFHCRSSYVLSNLYTSASGVYMHVCIYYLMHMQRAPTYGFSVQPKPDDGVDKRKKVMGMHIDDLERAYFDTRAKCKPSYGFELRGE